MPLKKRYRIFAVLSVLLLFAVLLFIWLIYISPPEVKDKSALDVPRIKISDTHYTHGNNWLRKNKYGIWEMYIEGDPFDRGVSIGCLSEELLEYQEKAFVDGVYKLLPQGFMVHFLKLMVAWQNRNLPDYIPVEYQKEIAGFSRYASDDYDYIGPKYHRKLLFHAAHDIGHTVQNMGLVGCSAFAAWGNKTEDGQIITGRNFDFYVGDEFKENKLLLFLKPNSGYGFVSYSWAGMLGVLSGMNERGLSISLNAGPPEMPKASKTPVSILGRHILQYASNIEEAINIANDFETFVSESFLICSADDGRCIIIEKSPDTLAIVEANDKLLISTNHFQSKLFNDLKSNLEFKKESSTLRRSQRLSTLLKDTILNPDLAVATLRDRGGNKSELFGMGNEENINILLAHHSILFQPESLTTWVSVGLNPMNEFIKYDISSFFNSSPKSDFFKFDEFIPSSEWTKSQEYVRYTTYHKLYNELEDKIRTDQKLSREQFDSLIQLNPQLYKAYSLAGLYYSDQGECEISESYLKSALTKIIPWKKDELEIQKALNECQL